MKPLLGSQGFGRTARNPRLLLRNWFGAWGLVLALLLVGAGRAARCQDNTYLLAVQTLQRGDYDRAERYFRALIANMSGKEGSRRIPYYETQKYREYYPHLGLASALWMRAREAAAVPAGGVPDAARQVSEQARARDTLLRQAISAAGRSLVERPSYAALWLLLQCLVDAGPAYRDAARALIAGTPFSVSDESWREAKDPLAAGPERKVGSAAFSVIWRYEGAGKPLHLRLGARLGPELAAPLLRDLGTGDLGALGKRGAELGAAGPLGDPARESRLDPSKAQSAWRELYDQVAVLPVFTINGGAAQPAAPLKGRIEIRARIENGTLEAWEFKNTDQESAPALGGGAGAEARFVWDTVANAVANAPHLLWLHFSYQGATGTRRRSRAPLSLLVKNDPPDAKLEAKVSRDPDQREVLLTVSSTRPLLAPTCDVWLDPRAVAGDGTADLKPDIPNISLTTAAEREDRLRFVYSRYYSLPRSLPTSLRVRASLVPNVGEVLVREAGVAVPEPLRIGLSLDRSRTGVTGPGSGPVLVTLSATEPIQPADAVLEVDFADGKVEQLPAAGGPPPVQLTPQSVQFSLPILERHPDGAARVRGRIGNIRARTQVLQIVKSVTTLQSINAEPSRLLKVGEPARVLLTYSAPLQQPPLATLLLNGQNVQASIPCDPEPEPGVYSFSFQPTAEGEYQIQPGASRDELGNVVVTPPAVDRTLRALRRDTIRLRPARNPAPEGLTRVFVEAAGAAGDVRVTVSRPGGARNVPLQPLAVQRGENGATFVDLRVDRGEEADAVLEASAPGRETERRTIHLDGQPPRFQLDGLPAVVTAADRLRCQITAFEPLRPGARPRIFVRQGTLAGREGEVEPDPDRPGQWLGSVLLQAQPGEARVYVTGVDLAGNQSAEESFQTVDVRLRQKTPAAIQVDRRRWGPGTHEIRVRSLGEPLTQAPELRLISPASEAAPTLIPLRREGSEFRGSYTVARAQTSGIAVLRVDGAAAAATQVILDTRPPLVSIGLPDTAMPGEKVAVVVSADEPLALARLQVKAVGTGGTATQDVPLRPAAGAERWLGELPVRPEHQSYECTVTGEDQAGLPMDPTTAMLTVRAVGWRLEASARVVGSGGVLRIKARPQPGQASEATLVQARLRYRTKAPVLPPITLQRAGGDEGTLAGEFPIDNGVATGDAEVVLLVNREEMRRIPVLLDTSAPELRVSTTSAGGRTLVTVRVENGDGLPGTPPLTGVVRGLNRRIEFRSAGDPWTFLAETDVSGAAPGAYRVDVEGADEAGNTGRGRGLVRVGGPLEVEWFTPVPAARVDRLNEIRFRVNGLVGERVLLTLTKADDPSVRVEATATLPDPAEPRPSAIVATRSLGPSLPEDTLEVRIDPGATLPYGPYRLDVRAQAEPSSPFLPVRNARVDFSFGPAQVGPAGRFAILVAVQEYRNLPRLQNPHRDAAKLRTALLQRGYLDRNVRVFTDVQPAAGLNLGSPQVKAGDATNLLNAIQAAADEARNQGVQYLVFAYFGHGASKEGRNYLIPSGVQLRFLERFSITPQDVVQVINGPTAGKPIPHTLLLLDACRNGAGARLTPAPLDPLNGDTLTAYYSCTQGEESLELLQPQAGTLAFTGGLFTEMFVRLLGAGSFKNWGGFEDELYGLVREAAAQLDGRSQRPERQAVPSSEAKATLPGFFDLTPKSASARRDGDQQRAVLHRLHRVGNAARQVQHLPRPEIQDFPLGFEPHFAQQHLDRDWTRHLMGRQVRPVAERLQHDTLFRHLHQREAGPSRGTILIRILQSPHHRVKIEHVDAPGMLPGVSLRRHMFFRHCLFSPGGRPAVSIARTRDPSTQGTRCGYV